MVLTVSRREGRKGIIRKQKQTIRFSLVTLFISLLVVIVFASANEINNNNNNNAPFIRKIGTRRTKSFISVNPTRTTAASANITPSTSTMAPRSSSTITSPTTVDDTNASVLRELKETIKKQALEIENLKAAKNKSAVSKVGAGGHGPPAGDDDDHKEYINRTFIQLAMKRVGWLSVFLVSLSGTAFIMNNFEHTLSKQIELAYFVPLLAGHGGNTGGQTVGSVLSAISNGSITSVKNDAPRIILKEALAGLLVGCLLGLLFGPIVHYVMGISLHVSTVIMCTLPLASTIASTLGSAIPFICLLLGLDPTIISAPAMTSFVDVSGLLSYFIIANIIFDMFGIEM